MPKSATPFLMFEGSAEAAMQLYAATFADCRIIEIERYGADGPGPEGSVKLAAFTLAGQRILCSDSFIKHAFSFTPSLSLFVECDSDAELDVAVHTLGDGGKLLMPADDYGFSARFAWLNDCFGVSWQLNVAKSAG